MLKGRFHTFALRFSRSGTCASPSEQENSFREECNVTRQPAFLTAILVFLASSALALSAQSVPTPSTGQITYLTGVNFPQTDRGLQQAVNSMIGTCGTVIIPPNITIAVSQAITVPSCIGGTNILQGSGNTTVLQLVTPAAQIIQSSGTVIRHLKIVSSQTTPAIGGEVLSRDTANVEADDITFVGGGTHIDYDAVTNFRISQTTHLSLTAKGNAIRIARSDHGRIVNPRIENFTAPPSDTYYGGLIRIGRGSSFVDIINPVILNIDGTTVRNYAGVDISTSHDVSLFGGLLSGLKNGDGVVTEDGATDVTITGTASYGNSNEPGAGFYGNNGDGFDIYNSARVHLSDCVGDNNGNLASNLQHGAEIFTSEDVTVSNCDLSGNGAEGVIVVGSPRTRLVDVTANRNSLAGIYFLQATGGVSVSGSQVTLLNGNGFGLAWQPATRIKIGSRMYEIASVTDAGHLVLTTSGGNRFTKYSVDSYTAELSSGTFNNNGSSGKMANGIYMADATSAVVSNVTATNDPSFGRTQLWGASLQNEASALFFNDNFAGNGAGPVDDGPGTSEQFGMTSVDGAQPAGSGGSRGVPCCRERRAPPHAIE